MTDVLAIRFALSRNGLHGFMDLPWDDYRIPAYFWTRTTKDEDTGCWITDIGSPQVMMVRRLLKVNKNAVLAAVPTCGRMHCANPAHICVTMKDQA